MLTALRALLGGWLVRIGGWLALAAGALGILWLREHRAEKRGEERVTADIERANIRVREEMAAVPKPDDAAVDEALRKGRF